MVMPPVTPAAGDLRSRSFPPGDRAVLQVLRFGSDDTRTVSAMHEASRTGPGGAGRSASSADLRRGTLPRRVGNQAWLGDVQDGVAMEAFR